MKYIHVAVQPPPPLSVSRTSSSKTETLYLIEVASPPPQPWGTTIPLSMSMYWTSSDYHSFSSLNILAKGLKHLADFPSNQVIRQAEIRINVTEILIKKNSFLLRCQESAASQWPLYGEVLIVGHRIQQAPAGQRSGRKEARTTHACDQRGTDVFLRNWPILSQGRALGLTLWKPARRVSNSPHHWDQCTSPQALRCFNSKDQNVLLRATWPQGRARPPQPGEAPRAGLLTWAASAWWQNLWSSWIPRLLWSHKTGAWGPSAGPPGAAPAASPSPPAAAACAASWPLRPSPSHHLNSQNSPHHLVFLPVLPPLPENKNSKQQLRSPTEQRPVTLFQLAVIRRVRDTARVGAGGGSL